MGVKDNIFQIPLNNFSDFVSEKSGIVDGHEVKFADTDTLFYCMTANRPSDMKSLPAKSIVRFQFLEVLVRLGIKKYLEGGIARNAKEAMEFLIE